MIDKLSAEGLEHRKRIVELEHLVGCVNRFLERHNEAELERAHEAAIEEALAEYSIETETIASARAPSWGGVEFVDLKPTLRKLSILESSNSSSKGSFNADVFPVNQKESPVSMRRASKLNASEVDDASASHVSIHPSAASSRSAVSRAMSFSFPEALKLPESALSPATPHRESLTTPTLTRGRSGSLIVPKKSAEERFKRDYSSSSIQFLRIKFALNALAATLSYSMAEDSLLRTCVAEFILDKEQVFRDSSKSERKRSRRIKQMEVEIADLRDSNNSYAAVNEALCSNIKVLEADIAELRANHADTAVELQRIGTENEVLLSQNAVYKAQLETSKAETESNSYSVKKLELKYKGMQSQLDEFYVENELLKTKLDQLKQRLSIALVERDELVRQFIPRGRYVKDELGCETLVVSDTESDSSESSTIDSKSIGGGGRDNKGRISVSEHNISSASKSGLKTPREPPEFVSWN